MASAASEWLQPVPSSVWQCAAASFAAYALLYRASSEACKRFLPAYQRLSFDKQVDWNTRLPSTVHALVVTAICFHQLITGAFSSAACAVDGVPAVLRTTPASWAAVGISLGYFAADGFMVTSHEALSGAMILVHHIVALLSLATAISVRGAHAYVLFGLFTEVTTPLINLRWQLQEAGASGTKLYMVNGLLMTVVWGCCRVLAFIPLFQHVHAHFADSLRYLPAYALAVLLGVPALLLVFNLLWFAKMVRGAMKLVRGAAGGSGRGMAKGAPGKGKGKGGRGADATVLVEAYSPVEIQKDE